MYSRLKPMHIGLRFFFLAASNSFPFANEINIILHRHKCSPNDFMPVGNDTNLITISHLKSSTACDSRRIL
jgi:hypothetical protein